MHAVVQLTFPINSVFGMAEKVVLYMKFILSYK